MNSFFLCLPKVFGSYLSFLLSIVLCVSHVYTAWWGLKKSLSVLVSTYTCCLICAWLTEGSQQVSVRWLRGRGGVQFLAYLEPRDTWPSAQPIEGTCHMSQQPCTSEPNPNGTCHLTLLGLSYKHDFPSTFMRSISLYFLRNFFDFIFKVYSL
jgi:hypothetical protein